VEGGKPIGNALGGGAGLTGCRPSFLGSPQQRRRPARRASLAWRCTSPQLSAKTWVFLNFSYANGCPEPVLVKRSFFSIKWHRKKPVSVPLRCRSCTQRHSVFSAFPMSVPSLSWQNEVSTKCKTWTKSAVLLTARLRLSGSSSIRESTAGALGHQYTGHLYEI
jgi:hypothetical protein